MKTWFYAFILLSFIITPLTVNAFQEGTYYAQSPDNQGMAVVFQNGAWGMYINQQLFDTGNYSIQSDSISFSAQSGRSYPAATIINDCSFSWGQSGTFIKDGCTTSQGNQNGVNPADYVPLVIITQDGRVLFYIRQLAIPTDNGVLYLETLSQLYDPNTLSFVMTAYNVIQNPQGYISALFAPQYLVIYCPYIALLVEGQQPQLLQNIFFQVQVDQNYIYFTLYNIYGSNMPTYSQYNSGQYNNNNSGSSNYDPATSSMYFNTMSNIMNTMHDTSMMIIDNMNPTPQWEYNYNY